METCWRISRVAIRGLGFHNHLQICGGEGGGFLCNFILHGSSIPMVLLTLVYRLCYVPPESTSSDELIFHEFANFTLQ